MIGLSGTSLPIELVFSPTSTFSTFATSTKVNLAPLFSGEDCAYEIGIEKTVVKNKIDKINFIFIPNKNFSVCIF